MKNFLTAENAANRLRLSKSFVAKIVPPLLKRPAHGENSPKFVGEYVREMKNAIRSL